MSVIFIVCAVIVIFWVWGDDIKKWIMDVIRAGKK